MSTWVLKLQQADQADHPILLHVSQKGKDGSLDLDLLATDGDSAYRTKVRERDLKKFQTAGFNGSDGEWQQIVRYGLVSKIEAGVRDTLRKNLEVECVLSGKKSKPSLAITFRSRVEEITHKLGSIDLTYSEDTDDVDLFSWTAQVIDQRDTLSQQVQEVQLKATSNVSQITELESRLKDLIEAKEEHEEQLLGKFAALLNEKKAYIRQQQATLASVDAPPVVPDTTSSGKKRKIASSKTEDDEESDGFQPMDIDRARGDFGHNEVSSSRETTPRRSSSSEDEEVLDKPVRTKGAQISKGVKDQEESKTPPPRALPFGSMEQDKIALPDRPSAAHSGQNETQGEPIGESDDETASEEDEL